MQAEDAKLNIQWNFLFYSYLYVHHHNSYYTVPHNLTETSFNSSSVRSSEILVREVEKNERVQSIHRCMVILRLYHFSHGQVNNGKQL